MAYDLTLSGSPAYNATGTAFTQSLSAGVGNLAGSPMPTAGTFTVQARFKSSTTSGIQVLVSQAGVFWIGTNGTTLLVKYGNAGGEVTATASVPVVNDGAYHHIALVLNGASGGSVFLDGVKLGSTNAATTSSAGMVYTNDFEVRQLTNLYPWVGEIDELAISNTALFSANFTPAAVGNADAGLVAVYHFENNGLNSCTATATASATPATAPGQPGQPTTVAGNASVVVTAVAPASNGGAAITGYTFYRTGVTAAIATNVASPFTDTGLTNGTAYTYTVAAVNSVGTSAQSVASASATPASATPAAPAGTAAANDPGILYSGSWLVTATNAKTINAGQYFSSMVPAGAVTLKFDLTNLVAPLPQVAVYVNGIRVVRAEVAATLSVPLDTSVSTETYNLVEVVVGATTETQSRWTPLATAVAFTGFTLGGTGALRKPTARPKRVIIFGDSITEGVRTLAATAPSSKDTDRNDAAQGWAFALRPLLGVEVDVVGFGKQGLLNAGSGGVPAVGSSYNLLWSAQSRDFTTSPPDLVIIMQGTNDGATDTTSAYTALLNSLLAATPAATKILALRPFNGTSQATFIQNAVAACTTPARVSYQDTTGYWASADSSDSLHPYGFANLSLVGPAVAAAARPLLNPASTSGTGLTAQQVRDAMLLAPSAGTPAALSLDLLLRQVQTSVNA